MNVDDSIQSDNAKYTFSLDDLIGINSYDDVYPDDNLVNHVAEPVMAYGFDQSEAYKSTFDINKTVNPYIRDLKSDDIDHLKKVVSSTLNNYKSILEQNPERILKLIEDFGKHIKVINKKLMGFYEHINEILQNIDSETDDSFNLTEKTFFEILDDIQLAYSILPMNSLDKKVQEEIEAILHRSIKHHQPVKLGYMRLRALQVVQNNYHSHLFQDKMHDLENACHRIITKEKIDEVKRGIDLLTPEGRYSIFEELTKERKDGTKMKRKDAVEIIEKELFLRYRLQIKQFHNSKAAFLNTYDTWKKRLEV
ncbi:hypothetical protein [Rhodohalobacter sp. SW132]|nr:hypothetical protein [Rhodohalobacter sp. SW132]